MKAKRDILEMLNGVEKQLDVDDALKRVDTIHQSSKSKKKIINRACKYLRGKTTEQK